jgi:single-strand DNA-binding protein
MLNKVVLIGRFTKDPELRSTQGGTSVASFTLAVERSYAKSGEDKETDFINVIAWRNTADFVAKYFTKGQLVAVSGKLQVRSWDDAQSGQKRYATDVVADEINFVDSKGESPAGKQTGTRPASQYTPESYGNPSFSSQDEDAPRFEDIPNDDDLPF